MEKQDKIHLLLSMQEHPEQYTDEQLLQMLADDPELAEQLEQLALTKQTFVKHEADEEAVPVDVPVYEADYKTLITLNRANGGSSYFDEGELVGKWTPRDFPENLSRLFARDPVDASTDFIVSRRIKAQGFCLYLAAVLFLL